MKSSKPKVAAIIRAFAQATRAQRRFDRITRQQHWCRKRARRANHRAVEYQRYKTKLVKLCDQFLQRA